MKAAIIAALLLTGCAGPTVVATVSDCTVLLPPSWEKGVEPPPLPADDTVGSWIVYGDSAVGKIDVANGRLADAFTICRNYNQAQQRAVQRSTKGFFGRLFD